MPADARSPWNVRRITASVIGNATELAATATDRMATNHGISVENSVSALATVESSAPSRSTRRRP